MSQSSLQEDFSFGLQGNIANVVGSGNRTMSDSSIGLYPVIDDPSKDWPFSKMVSRFLELTAMFFNMPFMSVNCSLTNFISCSCIVLITLDTASFHAGFLKFFIFSFSL